MIPDKRKEVDKALRLDERQQAGESPRYPKKGDKTDSIKHRLDEAESVILKMAQTMASMLRDIPEFRDDEYVRKHWFLKWSIKDAEKMIKKAEALLVKRNGKAQT